MPELIRIFFSEELSKKFSKMYRKEKNEFLKLITKIIASKGEYQKETVHYMGNAIYSSPRGHVANRILWFKKENEYYFADYFESHRNYDKSLDLSRQRKISRKLSYAEVTGII